MLQRGHNAKADSRDVEACAEVSKTCLMLACHMCLLSTHVAFKTNQHVIVCQACYSTMVYFIRRGSHVLNQNTTMSTVAMYSIQMSVSHFQGQ